LILSQLHLAQQHLQFLLTPLDLHISITSIKLERDLQSTLQPFNHFCSQISNFQNKIQLYIYPFF
jgi:hypothetical protein